MIFGRVRGRIRAAMRETTSKKRRSAPAGASDGTATSASRGQALARSAADAVSAEDLRTYGCMPQPSGWRRSMGAIGALPHLPKESGLSRNPDRSQALFRRSEGRVYGRPLFLPGDRTNSGGTLLSRRFDLSTVGFCLFVAIKA